MERLVNRSVYQPQADGQYPSGLLTKLVRNYRSRPAILKLPKEMFCDMMVTSNMVRWEHLPRPGFPVIFHALEGENLREAIRALGSILRKHSSGIRSTADERPPTYI
eukprot:scaffold831_cov109-Cylindrotheca_fusiformis.AAC.3